jgi:predicted RNA-binding protein
MKKVFYVYNYSFKILSKQGENMSKIKLALAAHNTERCFEAGVFGAANSRTATRLVDMQPGDILVFYKSKEGFAGIWEVTSSCYTDKTPIWEDGEYPTRVKIKPVIALNPDQYVDAKDLVDDLEMVKHPLYWGTAFRENLKDISDRDYELIKKKLKIIK